MHEGKRFSMDLYDTVNEYTEQIDCIPKRFGKPNMNKSKIGGFSTETSIHYIEVKQIRSEQFEVRLEIRLKLKLNLLLDNI